MNIYHSLPIRSQLKRDSFVIINFFCRSRSSARQKGHRWACCCIIM